MRHLRGYEYAHRERAQQHDGYAAHVEELERVTPALAAEAVALDENLWAEAQVDDDREDHELRDEVHDVQVAIAPERLAERAAVAVPGEEEVEERYDGAVKLRSAANVSGRRVDSLPDDGLANGRRDEEGDAGPTLLAELVEEGGDMGCGKELDDEEEVDTEGEGGWGAIEAGGGGDVSLGRCDNE